MRTLIAASALFLFGSVSTFAQSNSSANAILNVKVVDVKSIQISAGQTVNINLDEAAKFSNAAGTTGVNGDVVSTIDVISNGAYKIKVTLAGNETALRNSNASAQGIDAIPVDYIYLTVTNPRQIVDGSVAPSATFSANRQNLINKDVSLIATPEGGSGSSNAGTSGTQYDIVYTLAEYGSVASLAPGTFTGTVVYTITDL